MRKLAIVLIPLLLLVLVIGAVGCGSGDTMPSEAKEISDFLNGKHVNAVLWEEWNLFDELTLIVGIYEGSPQLITDFTEFSYQKKALFSRATQNYHDITDIVPPLYLNEFWNKIDGAINCLCRGLSPEMLSPPGNWSLKQYCPSKHAEAWLELSHICRQHNISMQWPLPRTP